jgi:nitroreductase
MLDIILDRTSIRSFEKGKHVPEEIVKKILDAGIRALVYIAKTAKCIDFNCN